jgi:hypothetical protein
LSSSNQFTSVENLPSILAYFNKIRLPFSPGKNDDGKPWSEVSTLSEIHSLKPQGRRDAEEKEMGDNHIS